MDVSNALAQGFSIWVHIPLGVRHQLTGGTQAIGRQTAKYFDPGSIWSS